MFGFKSVVSSILRRIADRIDPPSVNLAAANLAAANFPARPDCNVSAPSPTRAVPEATAVSQNRARLAETLEIEASLRIFLESALAAVGPSNCAVYLPTVAEDYSLSAFVNVDFPREVAEDSFDRVADYIGRPIESAFNEGEVRANCFLSLNANTGDLDRFFGRESELFEDKHVVIAPLVANGEVLGVLLLFRPNVPFASDALKTVAGMNEDFGKSLARVVRVHNRCLPPEEWTTAGN